MTRTTTAALLVATSGVLGLAACLDNSITGTRPLFIDIEASDSTVATAETVTFTYEATGTQIREITIDYGDGGDFQEIFTFPPVEVVDFTTYSFAAAGTYDVVAEVVVAGGSRADTVTIEVN